MYTDDTELFDDRLYDQDRKPEPAPSPVLAKEWGTWTQRAYTNSALSRYRVRDHWDAYTNRGRVSNVGGAMDTAEKAIQDGYAEFFTYPAGRDSFLAYYLNEHAHLITEQFVTGFNELLVGKGVPTSLQMTRYWIGCKLADMVWEGYFREETAFNNLKEEGGWDIRRSTVHEDKMLALDFIRWSPDYLVSEGIQVKAYSFLSKLVGGDFGLLKKVVGCHRSWAKGDDTRATYIYIALDGKSVTNSQRAALTYMLKSLGHSGEFAGQHVGSSDYLVIQTA